MVLADILYPLSVIRISAKFRIGASLLIYCVDIVFLAVHALVYILQVLEQAERLAVVLQCNSVSLYSVDVCVLRNVGILCNLKIVLCILRVQKVHKEAQKMECCYQFRAVFVCVLNSAEYIAFVQVACLG